MTKILCYKCKKPITETDSVVIFQFDPFGTFYYHTKCFYPKHIYNKILKEGLIK